MVGRERERKRGRKRERGRERERERERDRERKEIILSFIFLQLTNSVSQRFTRTTTLKIPYRLHSRTTSISAMQPFPVMPTWNGELIQTSPFHSSTLVGSPAGPISLSRTLTISAVANRPITVERFPSDSTIYTRPTTAVPYTSVRRSHLSYAAVIVTNHSRPPPTPVTLHRSVPLAARRPPPWPLPPLATTCLPLLYRSSSLSCC